MQQIVFKPAEGGFGQMMASFAKKVLKVFRFDEKT